jgi:hypothetical protein
VRGVVALAFDPVDLQKIVYCHGLLLSPAWVDVRNGNGFSSLSVDDVLSSLDLAGKHRPCTTEFKLIPTDA